MMPNDDPTWPVCNQVAGGCTPYKERKWCNHLRQYLLDNRDAGDILSGTRICVPMWPEHDIFTEVSIGTDEVIPGVYRLAIVKSDAFGLEEELLPLPLWSEGEGRMVITTVIKDWFRSDDPQRRCTSSSHGYREEMLLERLNDTKKQISRWHLLMHDMCGPCYEKTQHAAQTMMGGLSQVTPPSGGSDPMNQLRNRFA